MSAASAQTPRWSDSPWVPVSANCMAIGSTLILKPRSAWYSGLADSQQAPLPITQQTLWKRMHEQGLLHRETGQQKNQVRRTIGGKREYVVSIPALYVQETGPSGPTGPHAVQNQQNQHTPLDLFPVWYQQKPVHSEAVKSVHASQLQSPPTWTDFDAATAVVKLRVYARCAPVRQFL